jgi:hypothetical protein
VTPPTLDEVAALAAQDLRGALVVLEEARVAGNATPVLSRQRLVELEWGPQVGVGSNIVDVYVGYVRRKLGDDVIRTVRGVGYSLDV